MSCLKITADLKCIGENVFFYPKAHSFELSCLKLPTLSEYIPATPYKDCLARNVTKILVDSMSNCSNSEHFIIESTKFRLFISNQRVFDKMYVPLKKSDQFSLTHPACSAIITLKIQI